MSILVSDNSKPPELFWVADVLIESSGFFSSGLMRAKNQPLSIGDLSANWSPELLITVKDVFSLLVLRHQNGLDAVWYFDEFGMFAGNEVNFKPSAKVLKYGCLKVLLAYFKSVKYQPKSPLCRAFGRKKTFYQNFIDFLAASQDIDLRKIGAKSKREEDIYLAVMVPNQLRQDARLLSSNPSELDKLTVDGIEYVCGFSIVIDNTSAVYVFEDHLGSLLLMFEGGSISSCFAVLDEKSSSVYSHPKPQVSLSASQSLVAFFSHVVNHSDIIHTYLQENIILKSVIIRNHHLGHSLWNDLSSVYRIEKNHALDFVDSIVVYGEAEPWISIEDLVPSYIGYVIRGFNNSDLINYVYNNRVFLVRLGDDYISAKVPKRILARSRLVCDSFDEKQVDELRVVFGLRLENRTWTNQIDGLVSVARYLENKARQLTIIVDGHDLIGSTGAVLASACEKEEDNIVTLEKEIVSHLKLELSDSNIRIVDAVAISLECSLDWIASSDFFVAPWGAGLAKYKWICNLPGVVFSNQWTLARPHVIGLYDDPQKREGATPTTVVDKSYIIDSDDCDSVLITNPQQHQRANFYVDVDAIKNSIDDLLKTISESKK